MKKFRINWKKLGLIGLTLSTITAIGLTPVYINNISKSNEVSSKINIEASEIDFSSDIIQNASSDVLKMIIENNATTLENNGVSAFTNQEILKMEQEVKNHTDSALIHIQKNGFSEDFFEKFTPTISMEEIQNEQKRSLEENDISQSSFQEFEKTTSYSLIEDIFNLFNFEKLIRDLEIAEIAVSTAAVAAGLAAAGFWAAAWLWGLSVPWAIAASAVSLSLGFTASVIGDFKRAGKILYARIFENGWAKIDPIDLLVYVLNEALIAEGIKSLIKMSSPKLMGALVAGKATAIASGWAVPTIAATVVSVLALTLSYLSFFEII